MRTCVSVLLVCEREKSIIRTQTPQPASIAPKSPRGMVEGEAAQPRQSSLSHSFDLESFGEEGRGGKGELRV